LFGDELARDESVHDEFVQRRIGGELVSDELTRDELVWRRIGDDDLVRDELAATN
jgi:hypothetical protein